MFRPEMINNKKNTIYVSSFPKSGATWFQFLMYACYNGNYASSREVLRFYPPINRTNLIVNNNHNPLYLKSHKPYQPSLTHLTGKTKAIILVRHPLDVLLSLINHHKNQGSLRLYLPRFRKKFFQNFLDSNQRKTLTSWVYHLESWLKQDNISTHIISYSDLILDTFGTLVHLRDNYQLNFNDKDILKAVDYCSLANMKALELMELKEKKAGLFYSKRRNLTNKIFNSSFINSGGNKKYSHNFSEDYLSHSAMVFNPLLEAIGQKVINC